MDRNCPDCICFEAIPRHKIWYGSKIKFESCCWAYGLREKCEDIFGSKICDLNYKNVKEKK